MPVRLHRLLAWLFLVPLAVAAETPTVTVTLGLVAPLSEPDATSLLHGVQLAVVEANAAGPAPVRLEVRSDDGQWGTVGNDAVILVCDRHVDALITPSDGAASHLILQVSGRTRVPVASLCPDSSVTAAGVPWAVRVVPRTDREAGALFAAVRQPAGEPIVWWAVVPPDRPGRAIRRDLETAARLAATPLDRFVEDGKPHPDPTALVHAIAGAAPGGVLLWLPPSRAGAIAAALRAAGYGGRLAGPGQLDSPAFATAAGTAADGMLVAEFQGDAGLPARKEPFEKLYRHRYGAAPDFSASAAYDAARVLIEMLRRTGNTPAYRQFPPDRPTAGVTGDIHFDGAGNRTDALQVRTCRHGRFVPLSTTQQ